MRFKREVINDFPLSDNDICKIQRPDHRESSDNNSCKIYPVIDCEKRITLNQTNEILSN